MNQIFFWKQQDEYGMFSNFYVCNVEIDGKIWKTTEHYFAAMKSFDVKIQEKIRNAPTAFSAQKMGQDLKLRADWEQVKYEVMLKALRFKFKLEPFKSKLLSTVDAEIFEDSPYDDIWGTGIRGSKGKGRNLLGKALMQVREEMLKNV
jgi:ribA/ribD-fused uncharacterized protein